MNSPIFFGHQFITDANAISYSFQHPSKSNLVESSPSEIVVNIYQKCMSLFQQATFSQEDLFDIFNTEFYLRSLMTKPLKAEDIWSINNLYQDVVYPLLKKTKNWLISRVAYSAIIAAAEKGIAFQAGIKAIAEIITTGYPCLNACRNTFLLHQFHAVFKKINPRAKEEENLSRGLFAFKKQTIVPAFKFMNTSWSRWQLPLFLEEDMACGYTCSELKSLPNLEKQLFHYLNPKWQSLYLYWKFSHLGSNSTDSEPVFIPIFPNAKSYNRYKKWETVSWQYQSPDGQIFTVDFKCIQSLFLILNESIHSYPIKPLSISISDQKDFLFEDVISVLKHLHWRLILPNLYQNADKNKITYFAIEELKECDAQPFIKNMEILKKLKDHPNLLNSIFKKLHPEAEHCAILTGIFQMLDLHSENIGLKAWLSPAQKVYLNTEFAINSSPHIFSFQQLQYAYLLGEINGKTLITYKHSLSQSDWSHLFILKDIPHLEEALNSSWYLILFDMELCLGESNLLEIFEEKGLKTSLIPLRSALLDLAWKDYPLSPEVVVKLKKPDTVMWNWICRLDAPIRKRLQPKTHQQLNQLLNPILKQPQYQLSFQREQDKIGLIRSIRHRFASDLANKKLDEHQQIWELIENDLQRAIIRKNDTYAILAKRYKVNIMELQTLNEQKKLIGGEYIQLPHPCEKMSNTQKREWRFKIAYQLFPRLTYTQLKSLKQRLDNLYSYLHRYERLKSFNGQPEELINKIKKWINSSLYSHSEIKKLEMASAQILECPQLLNQLKEKIIADCQPTYFNIMKIMYPLLADAWELVKIWAPNSKEVIGSYKFPLEKIIQDIKKNHSPSHPNYLLSINFEQRMKAVKKPYFFYSK